MPITTSTNLEFPIPGAEEGDSRLLDIQAVKAALLSIDEQLGSYLIDNPTPTVTVTGEIISGIYSLLPENINSIEIELFGQNALEGTEVQWTLTGLSALSDQNAAIEPDVYSQTTGTVTFSGEYAYVAFDINPHTAVGVTEYFELNLVQISEARNSSTPVTLNFFISSDSPQV